jgi:hypothetical protein
MMALKTLIGCVVVIVSLPIARADDSQPYKNCLEDPARQEARSRELQEIVNADQSDRSAAPNIPEGQWPDILNRDLKRRKRVGEIFGEGCFKNSADYAAAALVYQHGDQPDHYFQAYIWSKRAVELGDASQKRLMALGVDRFLVNTGKKQLFASQASRPFDSNCWCLQPVESAFPDAKRKEFNAYSVKEALQWIDSLNAGRGCPAATECVNSDLTPTPPGSVPGIW